MKFGTIPLDQAYGAIAAHSLKLSGGTIRKGTRITQEHIDWARADNVETLMAARLDGTDMHEDEAARKVAEAVASSAVRVDKAFTGRSNLFARHAGVLLIDAPGVNALNRIDPSITLATLAEHRAVEAGRMIATVKIIPYAVSGARVYDALHALSEAGPLVDVLPYDAKPVGVISTRLPSLKESTIDKTLKVLKDRLAPTGAPIVCDIRVEHTADAVADAMQAARDAGAEILILFGASAVVDRADILPSGIERAGGRVDYFGMPVDPGNLLLIGSYGGRPVIGAPGCARSPKENGFDWVLQRTLAGLNVTGDDIVAMGVGGLLMEIVSRPQPRAEVSVVEAEPRIAALVLAAGRSSRMGASNKLVSTLDGQPLVRHVARSALDSACVSTSVVVGHMADRVTAALDGLEVSFVDNPDFADGLSTSLQAGLKALPDDIDAAIVLLGDMPRVDAETVDRLIGAYDPIQSALIVVPTHAGKRGNPVLWSRRYFNELMRLRGDVGARQLFDEFSEAVVELELGPAVAFDIDTPDALAEAGGTPVE